jgi:hypothetical protein
VEHISEQTLLAQFNGATDPLQKSFAALMLGYLHGDAMDMTRVIDTFGIKISKVDEYARRVLGKTASADQLDLMENSHSGRTVGSPAQNHMSEMSPSASRPHSAEGGAYLVELGQVGIEHDLVARWWRG